MAEKNNQITEKIVERNEPVARVVEQLEPLINDAVTRLSKHHEYEGIEFMLSNYRKIKDYVNKIPSNKKENLEEEEVVQQSMDNIWTIFNRVSVLEKRIDGIEKDNKEIKKENQEIKSDNQEIKEDNKKIKKVQERLENNIQRIETKQEQAIKDVRNETKENKKDTDKKIEVSRLETREDVEGLRQEIRILAEHLNNQDARHNHHDAMTAVLFQEQHRINMRLDEVNIKVDNVNEKVYRLSEIQKEFLLRFMDDQANKVAEGIELKDIEPDYAPGEEKHLTGLLEGMKGVSPYAFVKEAGINCMSTMAETALRMGLKEFKNYSEDKEFEDKSVFEHLKTRFVKSFTKKLFKVENNDWKVMIAEVGIKTLACVGIMIYTLYKADKVNRNLMEHWNVMLQTQEEMIIKNLKVETRAYFKSMLDHYLGGFRRSYNREDFRVKVDVVEKTETYNVYGGGHYTNNWDQSRGHVIATHTRVTGREYFYHRTFNTIPSYIQVLPRGSVELEIFKKHKDYSPFNLTPYLKSDLDEYKVKQIEYWFGIHRAYHNIGEFESKSFCGDSSIGKHLLGSILLPIAPYFAYNRIKNEVDWHHNATKLYETLRLMTIGCNSDTLDDIIKNREILFRLENYVDATNSPRGRKVMEKFSKEYKHLHIMPHKIKEFDPILELYMILKNIGRYNKDEWLRNLITLQQTQSAPTDIGKIILKTCKKGHEALEKASKENQVTTEDLAETPLPDGSKNRHSIKKTLPNTPGIILDHFTSLEDFYERMVKST